MIDYDSYRDELRRKRTEQREKNRASLSNEESQNYKIFTLLGLDDTGKVIPKGRQLEERMAKRTSWVMEEKQEYPPAEAKVRGLLGLKRRKIKVTKEEGTTSLKLDRYSFAYICCL